MDFYRIKREIKWFFEKIFKGYNRVELWDLEYYLAKMILKRLKAFRAMDRMGVPGNFVKEDGEPDSDAWDETLDKMIFAFQHIVWGNGMSDECTYKDEIWVPCEPKKVKLIQNFKPITIDTEYNREKDDYYNKKCEEGLKLFAEYFQGLWD